MQRCIINNCIKYSSISSSSRSGHIISRYYSGYSKNINNDELKKNITFKHTPSKEFEELKEMSYNELKETVEDLGSEIQIKSRPTIDHSHLSFIDKIRIHIKAGDGGGGGISFFRAKYIPEGPPDGGNGGLGANIIIRADFDDNNLSHLKKNYTGRNGGRGMSGKRTGKTGEDIILNVPVGTIVRELVKRDQPTSSESSEFNLKDSESIISKKDPRYDPTKPEFNPELYLKALSAPVIGGKINDPLNVITHLESASTLSKIEREESKRGEWIESGISTDLSYHGQEIIIASGGMGGKGNLNFVSGSNRSPEYAQPGTKGEIKHIELELKIIADFGLVGYPNAGKSTLLSVISNAIPNIQSYAFTTLNPYVGVIDFEEIDKQELNDRNKQAGIIQPSQQQSGEFNLSKRRRKLKLDNISTVIQTSTIADLPGILEGAHLNLGLGLDFLRHIERTKAIVYVVDMSNNGTPVIWDKKKLKVISNRYSYITDKDDLIEAKKEIKSKIYDDQYRAPWKDFTSLLEELENYKPGLTSKPSIIIANKMDNIHSLSHLDEFTKATKSLLKGKPWRIIPVSAKNNENILTVKKELKDILKQLHNGTTLKDNYGNDIQIEPIEIMDKEKGQVKKKVESIIKKKKPSVINFNKRL